MLVLDSQKREILEFLYKLPVIVEKPRVTYVSLYTGLDFFDIDPLCNHPIARNKVVSIYIDMIKQLQKTGVVFNKIVFIDKQGRGGVGPLVLASEIGDKVGLETVIVRSGTTCKCALCSELTIRGASAKPLSSKDNVVIITDVITAGSTATDVLNVIQNRGAKAVGIIAFLDREFEQNGKTAVEALKEKVLNVITFMKRSELVYLGFDTPTAEEVLSKNYLSEISSYLNLPMKEQEKLEAEIDKLVRELLKEQAPKLTPEQEKVFTNICATLAMRIKKNVVSLNL
jgi:adenine/guanine phosphoribosyltransferase-like PRPP-binding protein